MISFDLECEKGHRFEGIFKDHESFSDQLGRRLIACPVCECTDIKRLYTGCSIQPRPSEAPRIQKERGDLFEALKFIEGYVRKNFEYVGAQFSDTARAIHYGVEESRNIYGETTPRELKELLEEGIQVLPMPSVEKAEN